MNRFFSIGLAVGLVLHSPFAWAELAKDPNCDELLQFSRRWIDTDERLAADAFGTPLYSITNDDLDRIGKTIHQCETNATGHDEKVLFDQGIKALPKLRAARDHAVKSYAAFAKESAKAEMRLTAIAAAIDKLPATQQSRAQLADLRNEAASINFRVNEQRSAAVGRNEKSDEFPPFRQVTIAALRKESEIEDGLRQSRQAEAEA